VQTNPWEPGEIVFCWETGGKAPTRMWTVRADGSGLRPIYPEQPFEWITHEAVITKDEVAFTIIALFPPGAPGQTLPDKLELNYEAWGRAGTGDHPTGAAVVNLRTREMRIVGQVPFGDSGRSFWHINGSADGRWIVADDFQYRTWIIDRHTGETKHLSDIGHKTTAADHQHPTFNADGTKIEIQSAMLAPNGRSLNICVIPVPQDWLARHYPDSAASH
jgi:oligogalacturonide lyase